MRQTGRGCCGATASCGFAGGSWLLLVMATASSRQQTPSSLHVPHDGDASGSAAARISGGAAAAALSAAPLASAFRQRPLGGAGGRAALSSCAAGVGAASAAGDAASLARQGARRRPLARERRPLRVYGGVGLFAALACAADELLFAVPDSACLGVDDALADPLLGARLQQILDAVGPGGEVVALSAFLAKQLLVDGTRGAWWPYVGRRAAAGTTVTRSW
jgi:hypothetical protein